MTTFEELQELTRQAAATAKRFYSQGFAQDETVLAKRLALNLPLSKDNRKAAAFWFAAQKLFLSSEKTANPLERGLFLRGTLDLLLRCEQSLVETDAAQSKIAGLKRRCLEQLESFETPEPEPEPESIDLALLEADEVKALFDNKESIVSAMQTFAAQQKILAQEKLHFLPDVKLIGILGFDAVDGFELPVAVRQLLQHFVHLQTLFQTVQQSLIPETQTFVGRLVLTDLMKIKTEVIQASFIQDGTFIAVEILYQRVHEWMNKLDLNVQNLPGERPGHVQAQLNEQLVKACYRLGFNQDSTQSQVILTLKARAFFIGQGLLLEHQFGLQDKQLYLKNLDQAQMDGPIFAIMPIGQRLFVSMVGESNVAQVEVTPDLAGSLKMRGWSATEYFEVPENRQSLRIKQLEQELLRLSVSKTIHEVNAAARGCFLQLIELGTEWSDAFAQTETIKSVLRRKNLKLVWQEHSPFWVLKLRTELSDLFENEDFAKATQVAKFLKRFDF